ncbi:alpha/beta-hydrolase [Pluteus cervinus]|uniref:Alpha/beta-hydrolase n=1 Tax=Pluteus cervinus TaxID=181527 RepID=A0ACD3BET5_9AGAR|nr:alpha/beta-hydrolase [Pluteus cervinus]
MLLSHLLPFLSALPLVVLGRQVPRVPTDDAPSPNQAPVSPVVAGQLRVTENSGICETTPGVYQASGYGDIASSKSIWFWYFEARKNPASAPLALWFNGGPGSSSMLGLLQEHGPCRISNDSKTVSLNPNSWNNEVNMLYIDQPVGVGFSHGDTEVGTSQEAAADVWAFLQIFLKNSKFSFLQTNKLAIWTESYGGHYGPSFAAYFLSQNDKIASGSVSGVHLNLDVLAIGNGLTDPLTQYPGYLVYAANNPYHPLVSDSVIAEANSSWTASDGCKAQITACNNGGNTTVCSNAQSYCNSNILLPLKGDWDIHYVPSQDPDPYPAGITDYLHGVASKIGAESDWEETSITVYSNFADTGDWMRNSRQDLESVINAGIRTVILDGDADFILNYVGVEAMVDALNTKFTSTYKQQNWSTFNVRGQAAGQYKNAGTFSYIRVYGAGHQISAYSHGSLGTGEASLQVFNQIMSNQSLSST